MKPRLSVVAPLFNEARNIPELYHRVAKLEDIADLEIVLVENGSTDESALILERLAESDKRVKVVCLSRNFGKQGALGAGLDYATGDAVVTMDGDLQDPPELIREFVDRWAAGADVVFGVARRRKGESVVRRVGRFVFYYLLMSESDVPITRNAGDFRLMSRRVADLVRTMREYRPVYRGLSAWTGFVQVPVEYERDDRAQGATRYKLGGLYRFFMDNLSGYSLAPLRAITRLGIVIAAIGFLGAVAVVVNKLVNPSAGPLGWSSVMATLLFLGGVQMVVVGVIAEYVGRILEEVRGRPRYIVARELNVEGARQQLSAVRR